MTKSTEEQLKVEPMRPAPRLGVVVLAHQDPEHLARLLEALAPCSVAVHCDAATDADTYAEMQRIAPPGTVFLERRRTPWGSFALVLAELEGARAVLSDERVTHVATLSGADYPLLSHGEILAELEALGQRSFAVTSRLPAAFWGRKGGLYRFARVHWCVRGHDLWLPIKRPLPDGLVAAGGSAQKVLSRAHLEALLGLLDARPNLGEFFRRVWIADETLLPSLLESTVGEDRPDELVREHAWYVDWGSGGTRSPRWLTAADYPSIAGEQRARRLSGRPLMLFARKVSSARSALLLDQLDRDRGQTVTPLPPVMTRNT